MKKFAVFALAALLVPSVALAKNGPPAGKSSGSHGKAAPKVMYVLKGTLSAYTAASGSTTGSITITVDRANRHAWGFKTLTLPLTVTSATRIVLRHGATSITDGDRGIVKVKAPKNLGSASDLLAYFQATPPPNAFQVIDQG